MSFIKDIEENYKVYLRDIYDLCPKTSDMVSENAFNSLLDCPADFHHPNIESLFKMARVVILGKSRVGVILTYSEFTSKEMNKRRKENIDNIIKD